MSSVTAPRINQRTSDPAVEAQALAAGHSPVVARVIGARLSNLSLLTPDMANLSHFGGLSDMDKAANRLAMAIATGEVIGLETDHDVDGVTSHAVLYSALVDYFGHPKEKVRSYIGLRMTEGYGLSDGVADRILNDSVRCNLVVTADNGSSDEPRIQRLTEAGIEVIVSDHHEFPVEAGVTVPPASAFACVSPKHPASTYPDRFIAGCMVSWLVCCATRQVLMEIGHLPPTAPTLGGLLDYVALGTVADCVNLGASADNRAVVQYGLRLINEGRRPCWRAIREYLGGSLAPVTSLDFSFGIAPRINARGRLDEAMAGVRFLLSETDAEASQWAELLDEENQKRKAIEAGMKDEAKRAAAEQVRAGRKTLVVFLPNGHKGVHGIVASRLLEMYGRVAIMLSPDPKSEDLVSGSARGIDGFHVRDALQQVEDWHPGLLLHFGGHEAAAGMTLRRADIDTFSEAFEKAARLQIPDSQALEPVIWTDGELSAGEISLDLLDDLGVLEPFGQKCESPVFTGELDVSSVRPRGDGTHLELVFKLGGRAFRGMWFSAIERAGDEWPVAPGQRVFGVYQLQVNRFRGSAELQFMIRHAQPV